jgi:hypothetical protein
MSSSSLYEFRGLVESVLDGVEPSWGDDVLVPWIRAHPQVVAELREIGRPENHLLQVPRSRYYYTSLEGLYALSRLIDLLIAPHQPADPEPLDADEDWSKFPAASAWTGFREAIGARPVAESRFHPFFHEIVAVESTEDPGQPPQLVHEHWPGALIGGLLLVRSGVTVRAGTDVLDPMVAARSCLYWAWWRRYRKTYDLSCGWGHNSQWATDFRRDYYADGQLHYNVDAGPDDTPDEHELDRASRLELLRHRCSVHVDLGCDAWPFDETFTEPAPTPGIR